MDKINHAVIEFFVEKGGLGPLEIHSEMAKMLGDAVLSKTVVCKWAFDFFSEKVYTPVSYTHLDVYKRQT